MCPAITTDVSVGTALNIPWWTLCIFSALISLTAGVSRLNYPDMDKGSKNGKLGGHSLLKEFLICVILGYITKTFIYYETTEIPLQECLFENNRRHRKRCGERVTKSQMMLSRRTEWKHIALEGKPLEEGSMPSSVVMTLEAGQMSGLLLVSANRQTGGTTVTRGHVFWRGYPVRKNWTQHGLALAEAYQSSPVCLCILPRELQVKDSTLKPGGPSFIFLISIFMSITNNDNKNNLLF